MVSSERVKSLDNYNDKKMKMSFSNDLKSF
jgi:hypothetical protein